MYLKFQKLKVYWDRELKSFIYDTYKNKEKIINIPEVEENELLANEIYKRIGNNDLSSEGSIDSVSGTILEASIKEQEELIQDWINDVKEYYLLIFGNFLPEDTNLEEFNEKWNSCYEIYSPEDYFYSKKDIEDIKNIILSYK